MSNSTVSLATIFPTDVMVFAAENGVTDSLFPVWEMTRRVYPTARRIAPVLEYDPEIVGLRWIVFEVEIGGMTVEQYVDLHWRWSGELLKVCPATHARCFGLHEEIKDE